MQIGAYRNKSRLHQNISTTASKQVQEIDNQRLKPEDAANGIDHSNKIKIQILTRSRISVLSAPCGFGKSTLLILYLKQLYPGHQIVVTQPRRLTVTQLSHRVRQICEHRYSIKYAIQFDDQSNQVWDILYITEGLLLQKLINNISFTQNKIFVLDEAHELSNNMILLLSMFKKLLNYQSNVKLLVCSATVDIALFKQYLNCQTLEIQNTKKYTVYYETSNVLLDINGSVYLNVILNQILRSVTYIAESDTSSSILVFLPGQYEIEALYEKIIPYLKDGGALQSYGVVCLYASLGVSYVKTEGKNIYLATNIAETSLTLPNVVAVIDSGLQKKVVYNSLIKSYQLVTMFISKSNMQQRSGRAGRTCDGRYIGVYHASQLQDRQYVELENNNLCGFLMMYLRYFKTFENIDLIINMKYNHLKRNIHMLYTAGYIDRNGLILELGSFYLQHQYIDNINYVKLLYVSQNTKYYYQMVQLVSLLCALRSNGNRYLNLNVYDKLINRVNDFKVLIDICCMIDQLQNVSQIQKKLNINTDIVKYYVQLKNKILGKQALMQQDGAFPTDMFIQVFRDTNSLINNNHQFYNDYTQQYVVISKYTQVSLLSSKILYFDGIFSTKKSTKVYYILCSE